MHAVSPEHSLFTHMKYGSRRRVQPKIIHLAPLHGCTCAFKEWVYSKEAKSTTISWDGSLKEFLNMERNQFLLPPQHPHKTLPTIWTNIDLIRVNFATPLTVFQSYHIKLVKRPCANRPFEPHHEKTCLWGLQPGKTQTCSVTETARDLNFHF